MKNRMSRWCVGAAAALLAGVGVMGLTNSAVANQAGYGASQTAKVGQKAPDFTLTDLDGKSHTLSDYTKQGKIVVLEWFNPECPFVVKHHATHKTMYNLATEFKDKNVVWIAINSGAAGKQGHGHELNMRYTKEFGINYPLLIDESGKVGKMYDAKTTPHMYIINTDGVLVYNGAIDNNRSAATLGDINYVKQALTQVLAGETVATAETRPYGCSVKY